MNFHCLILVITVISLHESAYCLSTNTTSFESEDKSECHMNGKQIWEIPTANYSTIKILDLAYNNLANLPANIFQNKSYKELKILDLHENRINNVSSLAFRGLRKLENIDLSFNNLNELDTYTFERNRRLKKVDLTSNEIQFAKTRVFLVSTSIQTLIISSNKIKEIHELTFVGLRHLTSLILDHNENLNRIHIKSFRPLNDLQYLSLANTAVITLTTSMFSQIPRVINLQNTLLADKFDPPLNRIKGDQVISLLKTDEY